MPYYTAQLSRVEMDLFATVADRWVFWDEDVFGVEPLMELHTALGRAGDTELHLIPMTKSGWFNEIAPDVYQLTMKTKLEAERLLK